MGSFVLTTQSVVFVRQLELTRPWSHTVPANTLPSTPSQHRVLGSPRLASGSFFSMGKTTAKFSHFLQLFAHTVLSAGEGSPFSRVRCNTAESVLSGAATTPPTRRPFTTKQF